MVRCVFFGTPEVAAFALEKLVRANINVVGIVTRPDKPKGRGKINQPPPVKVVAQEILPEVPLFQPPKASDPAFIREIQSLKPDLNVVVAYGQIIKPDLLDAPALSSINLHFSLLPKYRGAAPFQRCLMNGDRETGVCIMHMTPELDAGDILGTGTIALDDQISAGELEKKLGEIGSQLLVQTIQDFQNGFVQGVPQDPSQVTYAPKVTSEEAHITWNQPAQILHNLVRGTTPKPGAWTHVLLKQQPKRLRLLKTRTRTDMKGAQGSILAYGKEGLIVACSSEALEIQVLQLEGKKPLDALTFCRGIPKENLSFIDA